jgi:hypothetical protein
MYADKLDHMYIRFRLAPHFPECNCLVRWGVPVRFMHDKLNLLITLGL